MQWLHFAGNGSENLETSKILYWLVYLTNGIVIGAAEVSLRGVLYADQFVRLDRLIVP